MKGQTMTLGNSPLLFSGQFNPGEFFSSVGSALNPGEFFNVPCTVLVIRKGCEMGKVVRWELWFIVLIRETICGCNYKDSTCKPEFEPVSYRMASRCSTN